MDSDCLKNKLSENTKAVIFVDALGILAEFIASKIFAKNITSH